MQVAEELETTIDAITRILSATNILALNATIGDRALEDVQEVIRGMTSTYVTEIQWNRHDAVAIGSSGGPSGALLAIKLF